jgi:hypothetical protein
VISSLLTSMPSSRDGPEIGGIMIKAIRPVEYVPAGGSRMEWMLRLVGTGIDGQSRSFDVMAISRSDGLGDIADLGLTLAEAKQLVAHVQQDVVAAQTDNHAMLRPDSRSCDGTCHVKERRPHRIATLFGDARNSAGLPRIRQA